MRKTNPCYVPAGLIDYEDDNHQVAPGSWRQLQINGLQQLPRTNSRHGHSQAEQVRARYCDYFSNEGSVPCQNECL